MRFPDVGHDVKQGLTTLANNFVKQLQAADPVDPRALAIDRETGATFFLLPDDEFPVGGAAATVDQIASHVESFGRIVFSDPLMCTSTETCVGQQSATRVVISDSLHTGACRKFTIHAIRTESEWRLTGVESHGSCEWKRKALVEMRWNNGSVAAVCYRLQEILRSCILRSVRAEGIVVPMAIGVDSVSGGVYSAGDAFCWSIEPDDMLDDTFVISQARRVASRWPAVTLGLVEGRMVSEISTSVNVRVTAASGGVFGQFVVSREEHADWRVSGSLPEI